MESKRSQVNLEPRVDGTYIIIDNVEGAEKITRKQVMELLEKYNIADMDFTAMNEIFKDQAPHIEKRISATTSFKQMDAKDETVTVETTADHMQASIRFTPPSGGGKALDFDDVMKAIEAAGIRFGIIKNDIKRFVESKTYNQKLTIAHGEHPINGTDGSLQFHFDTASKPASPKVLDTGKVDFRDLGLVKMATTNQLLVSAIPPTEGTNGCDVFGRPVNAKAGKPVPPMPAGKGVTISSDKLSAYAAFDGQILYVNKKVSINPVLEIKGNVDNSVGNLDFNGAIMIKGTVLTGFVIKAVGNIEVYGVVEGAKLKSDGHIFLYSGIQGSDRAEIEAGGNITAKFIESSKITAGGDIVADSILHSTVSCGGNLDVDGKKGLLVGGSFLVGRSLKAKNIGSTMATPTEIQIGHMPKEMDLYNQLKNELEKSRKAYDDQVKIVNMLSAGNIAELPQDKKNILLKAINSKKLSRDKIISLQSSINDLLNDLEGNKQSKISVRGIIRPGVKVMIGNAVMIIRDDIQNCVLINKEGKVSIQPYI